MSGTRFLNSDAMRVVERNERGRVTYRKRYKRGDEVDTKHLTDDRIAALEASNTLVDSKKKVRSTGRAAGPFPGAQVTGAALQQGADHSDIDDPGASPEERGEVDDSGDDDEKSTDGEDVDQFSAMDYGQLQDAAKAASPPIAANQTADELRTALRAASAPSA